MNNLLRFQNRALVAFRPGFLAVVMFAALVFIPTAQAREARIVGGTKVSSAAFAERWGSIVSIQVGVAGFQPNDYQRHSCGGTLIHPRLVVTAAHCVIELDSMRVSGMRFEVLAGTPTLQTGRYTRTNRATISDYYVHPSFRLTDDEVSGLDVAVLRLARPLTGVPTMPIVTPAQDIQWGNGSGLSAGAWTAGWGYTDFRPDEFEWFFAPRVANEASSALREVSLPLHSDARCARSDSPMGQEADFYDPNTMICGGTADRVSTPGNTSRGTCYGDSGGPLIVAVGGGEYRLAGLTSWGPVEPSPCRSWSVFTRIAQARDWIATIDPDASGANGLNVPAFTARQVGVDRLRIDWDAPATGPLPVRYRFFLGVSGAQLFDRAFDDIAEFAFLSNIVFEFRVASVGGTSRFVSINNVVPRRPGARVYRRLRLEVIDEDGNRAVSPLKLVLAPVDARRPTMPGLPRVTRRSSKGIQLYWNRSADNDCVRQYVIQARRASERFVARKVVVNDRCMNVGGTIFDPDMLGESGSIMSQSKWKPRIAGRYFVRVIAIDRAGNRRIGRSSRVVVRPNDTFALGDSRSDEEDDFEAEYEDE